MAGYPETILAEPPGSQARVLEHELVYQNPYQQVYRVLADLGTTVKEYFVNGFPRRVGVLVTRGDELLLVRQYRLLIAGLSWEIPGGGAGDDEPLDEAARRECWEETGVRCGALQPLLEFEAGLDAVNCPTAIFHTAEFEDPPAGWQGHETAEGVWVPLDRCLEMIFGHEIVDAFSIVALLAYRLRGERGGPS